MYEIYPSVQSTRELRDAYSFIGEFLRGEGRLNEAVPCFLTATAKSKDVLEKEDLKRYTPKQVMSEIYALQETLRLRMKYPEKDIVHTLAEIQKSFFEDERF